MHRLFQDVKRRLFPFVEEERRAYDRADAELELMVEHAGRTHTCWVFDVSISGALLLPRRSLTPGAEVALRIPRIPTVIPARVVRITGTMAGIQFDDPGHGLIVAGWSRGTLHDEIGPPGALGVR